MAGFWSKRTKEQEPPVSADFQRALMQEVMTTELLRTKALIATTTLLAIILWMPGPPRSN
jgi:adenylate cyclase